MLFVIEIVHLLELKNASVCGSVLQGKSRKSKIMAQRACKSA
jgi:hypothetical protein